MVNRSWVILVMYMLAGSACDDDDDFSLLTSKAIAKRDTVPGNESSGTQRIHIEEASQEHSQWCWAATAQSLLAAYAIQVSQCELATWVSQHKTAATGEEDCCGMDADFYTSGPCNRFNTFSGDDGSLQELLGAYGIETEAVYGALSEADFMYEIERGVPIIIQWAGEGLVGHFVVAYDFDTDAGGDTLIYFMDPWPQKGVSMASYDWMMMSPTNEPDFHIWFHTLIPIAPATQFCDSQSSCSFTEVRHPEVQPQGATERPSTDGCQLHQGAPDAPSILQILF